VEEEQKMEFKNHEQLRAIVDDEAKRLAIREVIQKQPIKRKWTDQLKHPLISVMVGFLLTGVVGTLLTRHFQNQEKKILLQKEAYSHIRQFSQAGAHRITEAAYLRSALLRPVEKSTLEERKKSYDESAKQWNTDLIKHLLTFREYAESRDPIFIEHNIEEDLVPIFRAIDVCLTEEFDDAIQTGGRVLANEEDCLTCWVRIGENEIAVELSSLLEASRICGYEISTLLFSWVTVNLKSDDKAWIDKSKNVQEIISQRCKAGYKTVEPCDREQLYQTVVLWGLRSDQANALLLKQKHRIVGPENDLRGPGTGQANYPL